MKRPRFEPPRVERNEFRSTRPPAPVLLLLLIVLLVLVLILVLLLLFLFLVRRPPCGYSVLMGAASEESLLGKIIADAYHLVEIRGRGAFGTVFKAHQYFCSQFVRPV